MKREQTIIRWFAMWLEQKAEGISDIFTPDAVYIECWRPKYVGLAKIQHWFEEWNTRGRVTQWKAKQFFHKEDQTVVQWTFSCEMKGEAAQSFEGLSLVRFDAEGKICFWQEFGCNTAHYDPYEYGATPVFKPTEEGVFF